MNLLPKNRLVALKQRQLCSITIKVMLIVFTYVVLSSSLGGPSSTAHAQSLEEPIGTSHIVRTVHAFLDCSKGSKAAQAYSIQHHYCTTTTSRGRIVPDGETYGDCGTAYLNGTNDGGGWMNYSIGGTSSQGALVAVDFIIRFGNGSYTGNGIDGPTLIGVPFQFGWSTNSVALTGSGLIYSSASGHYYLWWGGICYFDGLYDITREQ